MRRCPLDKTLLIELGHWLGQLRCAQDPRMSQKDLARLVGVTHATIGRMERGVYLLDELLLYRIGAALGKTRMQMIAPMSHILERRGRRAVSLAVCAGNPGVELAIASLDPTVVYSPEAVAVLNRAVVAMTRLTRRADLPTAS